MNSFFEMELQRALGSNEPTLWLAGDEATILPANDNVKVITHRFDVYTQLKAAGWQVAFNDYQLPDKTFQRIVYRVSKEKALVHYLINTAADHLLPEGELVLLGDKGEGIKTYSRKAQQRLGGERYEQKQGESWSCVLTRGPVTGERLDDQNYPELRTLTVDDLEVVTKPGVFGWNKIDQGSAFLIAKLPQMVSGPVESLLDLGCGFGYLTLQAHHLAQNITCTDNNAAALSACRANLEKAGIHADISAADAGDGIEGPYDLVLCNPPFHTGFNVDGDLTDRFLAATARLLQAGGKACFVVNKHIPLARKAASFFGHVQEHADNGHFKLFILASPKANPNRG